MRLASQRLDPPGLVIPRVALTCLEEKEVGGWEKNCERGWPGGRQGAKCKVDKWISKIIIIMIIIIDDDDNNNFNRIVFYVGAEVRPYTH